MFGVPTGLIIIYYFYIDCLLILLKIIKPQIKTARSK